MKKHFLRFVSFALAAAMLISFAPRAAAQTEITGDYDGNGKVDSDDAVYLLRHTLFPEMYPVDGDADVDRSGQVNSDDAVYLLRHTLFPELYPLAGTEIKNYRRGRVHISEMVYERPDFETPFALIETAMEALESHSASLGGMLDMIMEIDGRFGECKSAQELLNFIYSRDVTSDEMYEESVYFTNAYSELRSAYLELLAGVIDDRKYGVLFSDYSEAEKQAIRAAADAADEEYVELSVRMNELTLMYNDIYSCTVTVDGEEITLGDIEDEDVLYEKYCELCGDIYLEIVSITKALAVKEGAEDVLEYMYAVEYGRDYTPDDARAMIGYVKEYIAPMLASALRQYGSVYQRVNDIFDYDEQLTEYFASIDPLMLEAYEYLKEFGLYYGTDSPDAEDGAYTCYISMYDVPAIYAMLDGSVDDLSTFIHEFGHFYHFYMHGADSADQLDLCEIHSQADELMFIPVYTDIFGKRIGEKLAKNQLILGMYYLVQSCIFTEFELAVFEGERTGSDELFQLFGDIAAEYGLEYYFPAELWTEVIHFYVAPLYYVSYGTSLVPALQLYAVYAEDRETGAALYNSIVELSDSYATFLEVLEDSGLGDPFSEETFIAIAEMFAEAIS